MTRMNILAATAITALTATSAVAYTGVSPTIAAQVENKLETGGYDDYAIGQFSDRQVIELYLAMTSAEDDAASNERIEGVLAEVSNPNAKTIVLTPEEAAARDAMEPGTAVAASVQDMLDTMGFTVNVDDLNDGQVAELYFLQSESGQEASRETAETIING